MTGSWQNPRERELAEAYPELHAFLSGLRPGQLLSGTVAAIENFGVFVALDEGPPHPAHPGVGFIRVIDLTWQRVGSVAEVVQVGQRVTGEFQEHDAWQQEARLSLKALQPDPLRAFAATAGQEFRGSVTKVVPFGVVVRVADGVEGLLHEKDFTSAPPREGDEITVVLADFDLERRRVSFSQR
ncbi:S1 RNA-binding domain-containing protein [Lentzea sp. JNUCC 0626]|uniref:S1 RNA-binding domain-containing protein n=1 Tax=Lentzea sp. JNUCC 0626 TaxID=3367513 RepID=UPI003748D56A